MSEVDDFLSGTMPRLMHAERALHDGDAAPRLALWSHKDPVTLFGGANSNAGWQEVSRTFEGLASRFSDYRAYDVDVVAVAASGDLGYTVAYEHISASVEGTPKKYALRVTQIYRREEGEWKVVHRHGDELAEDQAQATERPSE